MQINICQCKISCNLAEALKTYCQTFKKLYFLVKTNLDSLMGLENSIQRNLKIKPSMTFCAVFIIY